MEATINQPKSRDRKVLFLEEEGGSPVGMLARRQWAWQQPGVVA